ncbi:hypothetical protein J4Q44_G00117010 [Coregonus suidteri]|uniref:Uncharacterized protein n=1 Tax=Coregonus suidteri TaxID=861788 RepID=A0AAN8QVQ1_9TELE
MALPVTAGCDTAWDRTLVCSDASSIAMQCLRPTGAVARIRLTLPLTQGAGAWLCLTLPLTQGAGAWLRLTLPLIQVAGAWLREAPAQFHNCCRPTPISNSLTYVLWTC